MPLDPNRFTRKTQEALGAAQRDAQGWTAVLRIPFASLRFTREHDGPWRIMVGRRIPREQFFLHTSVLVPREAPSFIATLQKRQGLQVACPEEIAYRQGWIGAADLQKLAAPLAKNGYGNYLLNLLK